MIREEAVGLNGIFSLIIVRKSRVFALVDRYGVNRIFYRNDGYNFLIGDDAWGIAGKDYLKVLNEEAVREWNFSGFVSYDESLVKNLRTLNASKILTYDKDERRVTVARYNSFRSPDTNNSDLNRMSIEFRKCCDEAGERLVSSMEGRTALVPMSGGMDSRFCAELLKRQGYEKVVCFTYGNEWGKEETIAREVANTMGFRHIFISYEASKWRNLFKDGHTAAYIRYACQLKATPHFSDWFPANRLSELFDPSECVVVPGHVGSVAESFFDPGEEYDNDGIIGMMIDRYYNFYGCENDDIYGSLRERLSSYDFTKEKVSGFEAQGYFDEAAYDTYRSNHLFMAVRPYEYLGFDVRMPLMDNCVVDFLKSVPLAFRGKMKTLLRTYVTESPDSYHSFHKEPVTYLGKVRRNLSDKRYNCINPLNVFKLRKKEFNLPPVRKVLYRYYRNYLSYVSAMTLHLILKGEFREREN